MNGMKPPGRYVDSNKRQIPVSQLSDYVWKRIARQTGRCTGLCELCSCVKDLKHIARGRVEFILFTMAGSPQLTRDQEKLLKSGLISENKCDDSDVVEVAIVVPPASLPPTDDDQL